MNKLEKYSSALELLSKKISNVGFIVVGGEEFLNGTWNPKKPLKLELMIGTMTMEKAHQVYGAELAQIQNILGKEFQIEIMTYEAQKASQGWSFGSQSTRILANFYEGTILKN